MATRLEFDWVIEGIEADGAEEIIVDVHEFEAFIFFMTRIRRGRHIFPWYLFFYLPFDGRVALSNTK